MTAEIEKSTGFISRIRDTATPYVTPLTPYVSKASGFVYGKNKMVDETLETTLSKMTELSSFTLEKVQSHVSPDVITKLDTFGCAQLDRLEVIGEQGNAALKSTLATYSWAKEAVIEKSNKAGEVVKTTLNTTVDKILPEETNVDAVASYDDTPVASASSFVEIGNKVYTRAKPLVSSSIAQTTAYLHLPSSYAEGLEKAGKVQGRILSELETVLPASAHTKLESLKVQLPQAAQTATEVAKKYSQYFQDSYISGNKYLETHLSWAYTKLGLYAPSVEVPPSTCTETEAPIPTAPSTPAISEDADETEEEDEDEDTQ